MNVKLFSVLYLFIVLLSFLSVIFMHYDINPIIINTQSVEYSVLSSSMRPPSNRPRSQLPISCRSDHSTSFNRRGKPCIQFSHANVYAVRISQPDLTYLFCAPPRCSSALQRAIGLRVMNLGNWDLQPVRNRNWSSFRLKQRDFAPLFMNESIPRFIIVRNPMVRVISAYIRAFHYDEDKDKDHQIPLHFEKWVLQNFPSIREHREKRKSIPWLNFTYPLDHLRPQTMYCGFNVRDVWTYFSIFKIEDKGAIADYMHKFMPTQFLHGWGSLNESLRNLLTAEHNMGRKPNKHGDLLSYLSFHRKKSDSKLHRFYRNKDIFERVAAAYEEDIVRLRYQNEVTNLKESLFGQQSIVERVFRLSNVEQFDNGDASIE